MAFKPAARPTMASGSSCRFETPMGTSLKSWRSTERRRDRDLPRRCGQETSSREPTKAAEPAAAPASAGRYTQGMPLLAGAGRAGDRDVRPTEAQRMGHARQPCPLDGSRLVEMGLSYGAKGVDLSIWYCPR